MQLPPSRRAMVKRLVGPTSTSAGSLVTAPPGLTPAQQTYVTSALQSALDDLVKNGLATPAGGSYSLTASGQAFASSLPA